jgi:hypothetical protein
MLYSEDCPGGEASAGVLRRVLSETAPGTEIEMVELSSRAFFELGTPGSPTILVNGRDLFPAGEGPSAAASCCRLYATPEGPKCHPTAGMVRDALGECGVGGERHRLLDSRLVALAALQPLHPGPEVGVIF